MGLKGLEGLREFCRELSTDSPSPGGGCASAAAGAMGASLLVMVCGIALKKKDAKSKDELSSLDGRLEKLRDRLIALSDEDTKSFDFVMDAVRRRRAKDDADSKKAVQDATVHAADVPMETAQACLEVLEISLRVAELGLKSTSSDLAVGVLLANAGLRGALMNVRVNLRDIGDKGYVTTAKEKLEGCVRRGDLALSAVLTKVEERYGS